MGFVVMARLAMEVGTNAILQVYGFANINDRPLGILHQVTTWFKRGGIQDAF
jgi:hypothetical protein